MSKELRGKIESIISRETNLLYYKLPTEPIDKATTLILSLIQREVEGMKKKPTISIESGSPDYHIEYNQALFDLMERMEEK